MLSTRKTVSKRSSQVDKAREQARRYMEAVYGKNVWFKAPETFSNVLERWIWAVASSTEDTLGEECMTAIEAKMTEVRQGG
jgi:hypothetical protein